MGISRFTFGPPVLPFRPIVNAGGVAVLERLLVDMDGLADAGALAWLRLAKDACRPSMNKRLIGWTPSQSCFRLARHVLVDGELVAEHLASLMHWRSAKWCDFALEQLARGGIVPHIVGSPVPPRRHWPTIAANAAKLIAHIGTPPASCLHRTRLDIYLPDVAAAVARGEVWPGTGIPERKRRAARKPQDASDGSQATARGGSGGNGL